MGIGSQAQVGEKRISTTHLRTVVWKEKERKKNLSSALPKEQFITKRLLETACVGLLPFRPSVDCLNEKWEHINHLMDYKG